MEYRPEKPLTAAGILEALGALGIGLMVDPEHGPDEITDEHRPDLLGALAGAVDSYIGINVGPAEAAAFMHGYRANISMTPDRANEITLSQLGIRLTLEADLVAGTAREVGYARLAAPLVELAAHTTMMAASTADKADDDTVDTATVRAHHKTLRRRLKDTRAQLDAVERRLRKEGYDL